VFIAVGQRVLRVPTRLDEDERLHRLWLTRADPNWHVRRWNGLVHEGNAYGAALHRSLEQRARGVLALEAGDLDRAWGHFIVAAALKPAPPPTPEILPPPPTMIPVAK
jgi:hypothetical protein